jgi:hypothetical protein
MFGVSVMLSTDCDVAPGNSGGAMLVGFSSGQQRLLAIAIGGVTTSGGPKVRNKPQDGAYNERTWSSLAVPLAGEFRAALERALGRPVSSPMVSKPIFQPAMGMTILPSTGKAIFPPVPHPATEGATPEDGPKEQAKESVKDDAEADAQESAKSETNPD